MSKEQDQFPAQDKPYQLFGFTEQEFSAWRVSNERFCEFLKDPAIKILQAQESSNNYGEFLFVTVNRDHAKERLDFTFYGLGYHEYREKWIIDEWFWYRANMLKGKTRKPFSKPEVEKLIKKRREEILPNCTEEKRSERARLFEFLADLTDEDGAYAELEDLGL